jgi:hypothetical protein
MMWIWVALLAALLYFFLWLAFKAGQMRGYKEGARTVLIAWKKTVNDMEEIDNG